MGLGPPELIIIFMLLALVVLPIWGIVDAAMRPGSVWAAAGQNKVVWVVVQLFLGALGSAVYFLVIRPQLKRATAA